IRLDALTFRKIVLLVDYICDGAFFLSVDPAEFLASVSRVRDVTRSPLEIRGTATSFAGELYAAFARGSGNHGLVFDSIRDPALRLLVASGLKSARSAGWENRARHAESVAIAAGQFVYEVIRRAGGEPDEDVERLVRGWRAWEGQLARGAELKL